MVRGRDIAARTVFFACGAFVVLATVAMLSFLARAGLRGIQSVGLGALLSGLVWRPENRAFGGFPLLFGTLVTALGALLVGAVPAVLSAVFVNELGPRDARAPYRRTMELAAAVPSVVYGWIGLIYLVPLMGEVGRVLQGPDATGEGLASTAILLGVMIGPTVTLLALDALARVPAPLREASAALGASKLQTAMRVSLPSSSRGLIVAVFFGFARAAGETLAVQMVIGGARQLPRGFFAPTTTIASQIVTDVGNAAPGTPANDVLFSMALVLLAISVFVVLVARVSRRR